MKKFGYTLQELLLAMAIIGVVSALTIPMISRGSHNQAYASKLAAMVADFENGLSTMIVREVVEDLTETEWYQNDFEAEDLVNSYRIQDVYNLGNNGTYNASTVEDGNRRTYQINYDIAYQANNGALIFIDKANHWVQRDGVGTYLGNVFFDVNGEETPNRAGRDIFGYALTSTGHLYPLGGERASMFIHNNDDDVWTDGSCENGNLTINCTARLAEQGYKVDY